MIIHVQALADGLVQKFPFRHGSSGLPGLGERVSPDSRVFDGAAFVVVHGAGRNESPHGFRTGKMEFNQIFRQGIAAGFGCLHHFLHDAARPRDVFRVLVKFRNADASQSQAKSVKRDVPDEFVPLDLLCGVKGARFDAGIGKQLGEFPGFFSPFRSGDEGGKLDIAPFQMVDMARFFPHGADEAQTHIDTVRRDDAGNFLRIPHAVLKCNNSCIRSHQRGKGFGKSGV